MTNKYNAVLYTGVTSDLYSRVYRHKTKDHPNSFSARYNCNRLVYYNSFQTIEEAIAEEKRIKGCSKTYKQQLVESVNPTWLDLYEELPDKA